MTFLSKIVALTDMSGDLVDNSMLLSELNSIEHHIEEIRSHLTLNEVAPDWVKSKISVAADELSDIAHFIMGLKAARDESADSDESYDDDVDPDYQEVDEEEE
jgi:protein subunit release factor A